MSASYPFGRLFRVLATTGLLVAVAGCVPSKDYVEPVSTKETAKDSTEIRVARLLRFCERLRDAGDLQVAVGICRRAHEIDPDNPEPLIGLADTLNALGADREAADAYRQALALEPNNIEALLGLGKSYVALGENDLAVQQFENALAVDDRDHRVYNALGVTNDLQKEHSIAQAYYRSGLEIAPEDVELRSNLGLSLALSGQHEEAIAVLGDLVDNYAGDAVSRQNLALAYGLAGDGESARRIGRIDLPPEVADANVEYYAAMRGNQATPVVAQAEPAPETEIAVATLPPPEAEEDFAAVSPPTPLIEEEAADPAPVPAGNQIYETTDEELEVAVLDINGENEVDETPRVSWSETPEATADAESEAATQSAAEAHRMSMTRYAERYQARDAADDGAAPTLRADPMDEVLADIGVDENGPTPTTRDTAAAPADDVLEAPATTAVASLTPNFDAGDEGFGVQLGSYRDEDGPASAWEKIKADAGGILDDMEPVIARADLGPEKGVFFRLRTPSFGDRASAEQLCSELAARNVECLVVRTEAENVGPTGMLDVTPVART